MIIRHLLPLLLLVISLNALGQNMRTTQAKALDTLHKMKPAFQKATNDSLFIIKNSDNVFKYYNFTIGDQPEDIEEQIYTAKVGDVVGPFRGADSSNYLFKIISFNKYTVRCRAKLIYIRSNQDSKQDTASISKLTKKYYDHHKKGKDMETLSHKDNTRLIISDLKWYYEGEKDKKFYDKIFNMNEGDAVMVNTEKGPAILTVTKSKVRIPSAVRLIAVVKKG